MELLHRLLYRIVFLDEARVLDDFVVGDFGVDQADWSFTHRLALSLEGLHLRVMLVRRQQSHNI